MISCRLLPFLLALSLLGCAEPDGELPEFESGHRAGQTDDAGEAKPAESGTEPADDESQTDDPEEGSTDEGAPHAPVPDAKRAFAEIGERDAQKLYERHCRACHTVGAAGSPRLGDESWWEEAHDEQGMDGLLRSVERGKGAMPRRGMCMDCTGDELRRIIAWMLGEAGVEVSR